jgi:uridine monophosphate synthetase
MAQAREELQKEITLELHEIGALKFGEFTFKSGIKSPMYMDLRLFISYPKLLKKVAKAYAMLIEPLTYDRLAGIAYAALPIAGAVSLEMEKPWIYMRKEGIAKSYGLKKAIEGEFEPNDVIVVIDDLITKGDSKLEVIEPFQSNNLKINDFVVLIDYQKGGGALLKEKGYNLHSFLTMHDVIRIMKEESRIDDEKYKQCLDFLES